MNFFRGAVGIAMKASRLETLQGVGLLELTVRGCGPITAEFGQIWPLEQKTQPKGTPLDLKNVCCPDSGCKIAFKTGGASCSRKISMIRNKLGTLNSTS